MIHKIFIAFLTLAFWNISIAQENRFSSSLYSHYLGGNGGNFYDGPVLQSKLFSQWESGIYTQVWVSVSDGSEGDFGNEGNFKGGYADKCGKLDCSIEVQYLAVHGVDIYNVNGEISLGHFFARIEAYRPVRSGGPRKGFSNFIGIRNSFSLSSKATLSLQQQLLYDTGAFGFEKGWLTMTSAGFDFDVGESDGFILNTGLVFSLPLSVDDREGDRAVNAGFTFIF